MAGRMKIKIIMILLIGIIIGVFIAKGSVKELAPITADSSKPVTYNDILCYQKTKNICVDYMGEHPDFCTTGYDIRHKWCHENYCIDKEFSCIGAGTNQCITEDSGKCIYK
jgi:hypothetical protein